MVMAAISEERVMQALSEIADPEIPAISIVDLGMVSAVEIDGVDVSIELMPTFVGCPAIDVITQDVGTAVSAIGGRAQIKLVYDPPWTSDRVSPTGREKLREYGLAPPPSRRDGKVSLTLLAPAPCPYCGSKNTVMESPFGPTACRATSYCRSCRNPFEQFKTV